MNLIVLIVGWTVLGWIAIYSTLWIADVVVYATIRTFMQVYGGWKEGVTFWQKFKSICVLFAGHAKRCHFEDAYITQVKTDHWRYDRPCKLRRIEE
jgi:hypothetical protein